MGESIKRVKISDAIIATLKQSSPLTNLELCTRAVAITGCTASGVRKAIWVLAEECALYVDKTQQKKHLYSLADGEPVRHRVLASRFKLPLKLRGPVLSPMAWCARQLGAM
jgi:hypothetical protein